MCRDMPATLIAECPRRKVPGSRLGVGAQGTSHNNGINLPTITGGSDVNGAISPSDPTVILAGIKQFGLAADGSDLRHLEAAIDRLRAENERLRATLEPFALAAEKLTGVNWVPDGCPVNPRPSDPIGAVTVRDYRAALAALSPRQGEEPLTHSKSEGGS